MIEVNGASMGVFLQVVYRFGIVDKEADSIVRDYYGVNVSQSAIQ